LVGGKTIVGMNESLLRLDFCIPYHTIRNVANRSLVGRLAVNSKQNQMFCYIK
jgi:hypothetical protein